MRRFISLLKCLPLLCGLASTFSAPSAEEYAVPSASPIKRQIRFTITIQNPTNQTLQNQTLYLYAPVKRTATQQVEKLDISLPYRLQEDELQNQLVEIQFDHFPPYATKIVTLKADLLMFAQPATSIIKNKKIFLTEEPFIEINDKHIQATAKQLNQATPIKTVSSIYEWVKNTMTYAGYVAEDRGARYAITSKRGDCTEYAYLATALARANNIPARTLGGYVLDRNGAPKAPDYHNWTEVYFDDKWQLLDAQKRNLQRPTENYIAMRIISNQIKNPLGNAHRFKVDGELLVKINE